MREKVERGFEGSGLIVWGSDEDNKKKNEMEEKNKKISRIIK